MEIPKPLEHIIKSLFSNKPDWLNRQIVLLIATLLVFLIAIVLSEPLPQASAMQINRQESGHKLVSSPNNVTKLNLNDISEDGQTNTQQTDSVIFGGVILLCIITGGVLMEIRQKKQADLAEKDHDNE